MRTRHLAVTFALLTVTATGIVAVAVPAQAGKRTDITVRTSDRTPANGQTFHIHGKFIDPGTNAVRGLLHLLAVRNVAAF